MHCQPAKGYQSHVEEDHITRFDIGFRKSLSIQRIDDISHCDLLAAFQHATLQPCYVNQRHRVKIGLTFSTPSFCNP